VDVFHGVELIPPKILHQRPELPPRETRRKTRVEFRRAVRAATTVVQPAQERKELLIVERHGFLGAGTLPHGQTPTLALAPSHEAGVGHEVAPLALSVLVTGECPRRIVAISCHMTRMVHLTELSL